MSEKIFVDWDADTTANWGNEIVQIGHRLHQSPLFTDEALAKLIETYPREHYDLHTMTVAESGHHAESWREGDLGTSSGMEVLNAIKSGNIWLNLRKVMLVSEPYRALLEQIFSEVEGNIPGLKTFKHNFGILMSSPTAQVFYHSDIPGQSLWQIRGRKRVFVYPIEAPFITPEAIEKIILNEADEQDMPYSPWFDEQATIFDLEAGQMLHWPLNGPHRVVNLDCFNISVTTEHWSPEIRASYACHYANGILRRHGVANPVHQTSGPV
ncbi:MAG: hypothetical protein HKN60_04065, partial [Rhizobiales bacterium]|nr:hypothetical protein [Hyphomicrobiales bacterium]